MIKIKQLPHYLRGKKMSTEHREKLSESHKGVKLSEEHKKSLSKARRGRPLYKKRKYYSIVSPSGETIIFTGMKEFCRNNSIHESDFNRCKNGHKKHIKGWHSIKVLTE